MFWIAAVAMTPPRPPYSSARASASERAPGSRPAQRGGAERRRARASASERAPGSRPAQRGGAERRRARASASERAPGSRPAQRGGAERSRKPAHEHVAPPGIGDHGGLEPGLLQQPQPGGAREEPFDVAVVHDAGDARLVAEQDRVVHP